MPKTPVIVAAVRTPIGRAHPEKGLFRDIRGDDLAAACVSALLEQTGIDPNEIEDVLFGCSQPTLELGLNVGRIAGLLGGVPASAAGATINRLCGSSLQALNQAAHAIVAGAEDVHIVGGVEHMHHVTMDHALDINPKLFRHTSRGALLMGATAEFLAQSQGISRAEQDAFALRSHTLASQAHATGEFKTEIVPIFGQNESGNPLLVDFDQCVRPDTSIESLAALEPAFLPQIGTVTAGNSSPLNDGAAALLVMSLEKAQALRLKPLARICASAVAGVDPCMMGIGPVPAVRKALERCGLQLAQVDLVELNEAFAVQALACLRMLSLDLDRVNLRGGALALGHPLGASGARIATTLVHNLVDRRARFGIATMCIGLGQGIATVLERFD